MSNPKGFEGDAADIEEVANAISSSGKVIKDASKGGSRVYTKVIEVGNITMRFYIDHRNGTGTIKIRRKI